MAIHAAKLPPLTRPTLEERVTDLELHLLKLVGILQAERSLGAKVMDSLREILEQREKEATGDRYPPDWAGASRGYE